MDYQYKLLDSHRNSKNIELIHIELKNITNFKI